MSARRGDLLGQEVTRQQFLSRGLAVAASVGGLSSALAACGTGSPTTSGDVGKPPSRPTGTFTMAIAQTPGSVDPVRRQSSGDFNVSQPLFDGLLRWDREYAQVQPALISDFSFSSDNREWVGRIRPDVKFHDGEAFDSTAVRRNLEYYAASTAYLGAYLLPKFSKIDDSDPGVIRLVAKDPAPDLVGNFTLLGMVSPRLLAGGEGGVDIDKSNKAIERTPAGTGAFKLASRSSTSFEFEPNPDYWEPGKPYFEHLRMHVIADDGARLSALQSGQVNAVVELGQAELTQLKGDQRVKLVSNDTWTVSYLLCKLLTKPVDELKVRQAIAYGIDRQAIAHALMKDIARPASAYMPEGTYGYQPMDPSYGYDPARASALLREASGGKPVSLALAVPAGGGVYANEQTAEAIAGQLQRVGFAVEVHPREEVLFNKENGEKRPRDQAFLLSHPWSTGGPFIFQFDTFSSLPNLPDADKAAGARSAALVAKMMSTPDGAERMRLIGELQRLAATTLGYIPLFYFRQVDGVSANVQSYVVPKDGLGNHRLEAAYFA